MTTLATSIPRPVNHRFATTLLACSMFMTGACGLVLEYVLGTVSTYILGNSIEQFSIIIALMLLMMGVAGFLQTFLTDSNLLGKFLCGFLTATSLYHHQIFSIP